MKDKDDLDEFGLKEVNPDNGIAPVGLSAAQYALLEAQVVAGQVKYEWTEPDIRSISPGASFTDATRPAASSCPGMVVFNRDSMQVEVSDGVYWRDSQGAIT